MEKLIDVCVPDIGDFQQVEVIEVLVAPGEQIVIDQPLITLESDKASMEIPAEVAGKVVEVKVRLGDKIGEGEVFLLLEASSTTTSSSETAPAPVPMPDQNTAHVTAPRQAFEVNELKPVMDDQSQRKEHASPSVRRFARELGADIGRIEGTGPKGRILKDDVKSWIKRTLSAPGSGLSAPSGSGIPPVPEIDFSQFGSTEIVALSRIKRISGTHLHRSWLNLPMVTVHEEVDITALEDFRKSIKEEAAQEGVRVTSLAFIMKSLEDALRIFPHFNASLGSDGQSLICKKFFNIGVAVDTSNGLVVPVIRDVEQKSVYQISAELAELSAKARDGKLTPTDLSGGCMTISSLGGIGCTAFTPIVNAPEVAILGVSQARMQPVWNGNEFVPRLMLPLDLSFDHRVIDGAEAGRFLVRLCQTLGDIRRLLL